MASIQEPGTIRLYRMTPSGNKQRILRARTSRLAPSGGAPDGAHASIVSPEKLTRLNSNVTLNTDDILLATFKPDTGGDGIDASDCIWDLPIVTPSGSDTLGASDFQDPALADMTLVANEQVIAGYKVTERSLRVAGAVFMDIQDDTA